MQNTIKFYFFHQLNVTQSPLCKIGSMETKRNFQSQDTGSSVLFSLSVRHLIFWKMSTANCLNLTTAPTYNSQITQPWQSTMSFSPSILISFSYKSSGHLNSLLTDMIVVIYVLPSVFLLDISNQFSSHPCPLKLRYTICNPVGKNQGQDGWDTVYQVHSSVW